MDDRGRVTIGKELAKKYGREFFVVQAPREIILIPKSKDPIKELQEWGKKAKLGNLGPDKLRKLAEEQAYAEIDKKHKFNKK